MYLQPDQTRLTNSIATKLTLYGDTVTANALTASKQNNIALQTLDKTNFLLYPNPVKTIATIAFDETGNCVIKVTDVSGRVLQTKTVTAVKGGNTLQLNVSKYAAGVYWVTIINKKNENHTIKLKKVN